ncbi:2092_t:CDS:2 [Funneliformis caledonium]|uniref:2092_t:CDS:1 n=1 Tax=Funneliformis caledonium TaxID=1117310 RepID=A0A9N9BRX3_9GLOM|nr:2092_t:CDS:2 [Funneliformis caledonium]
MDDNYRETMVKSLIITYWNRKNVSKSVGLYDCLKQTHNKFKLKFKDKPAFNRFYKERINFIAQLPSVNVHLKNKAKSEQNDFRLNSTSDKVNDFWEEIERIDKENKVRKEYRSSIDQHLREEKKYLSTVHLKELQEDDAINEVYDAEEENVSTGYKSDEDDDLDMAENINNCSETNRENSDDNKDFGDSVIPVYADTFAERLECQPTLGRTRRWILPSGTDVSEVLEEYVKTVPGCQKCLK